MKALNGNIGVFVPWGDGIGTLGIKLGRLYADIFWSNYPMAVVDDEGRVEYDTYNGWRDYLPSGIFFRLPWFKVGGRVIGGAAYRLFFRRPWRLRRAS